MECKNDGAALGVDGYGWARGGGWRDGAAAMREAAACAAAAWHLEMAHNAAPGTGQAARHQWLAERTAAVIRALPLPETGK